MTSPAVPEPITPDAPPPLTGRVVAAQRWNDVAFLHWRVEPELVAPLLPEGIRPDTLHGATYVGLIAFRLSEAQIGPLPPIPHWGDFTEVNVRLIGVDARGRRGVVFSSLEAASLPAVLAARAAFSLPYIWSRTAQRRSGDVYDYGSRRRIGGERFSLRIEVDRTRTVHEEADEFVTARWALFQRRLGRTMHLANTHEPWVLHPATLLGLQDDLLAAAGLPGLADRVPDSVLFSPGVTSRFGTRPA